MWYNSSVAKERTVITLQEFIKVYLLIGIAYVIWLLIVNVAFRTRKNYVADPREAQVKNKNAYAMGIIGSHLVAAILWPLVIMWRVIEYEYMDQKSMFYEQQFIRLKEELQKVGVIFKDDKDGE